MLQSHGISHFIHHSHAKSSCQDVPKIFDKCYCCQKSSCHNVWDFCNPKGWKELGLAKNTVLRNYRDWIDKSTNKQFYGAFWTCHKTAHKWKTCTLYTFNSPCPLHCIYTLSHKSWSMSVRSHSTQRGRLIGWRQFLKTVASAHWKHPRTHSPWEDPPEHKSSSDRLAFQLTRKHHIVLILWYILLHCQLCCDFVVIHRTFQAKSFNISGLDSKGTSVHPRDSRSRKVYKNVAHQVLTAETPNEPFGFVPCPHPWPDGKSPTVLLSTSPHRNGASSSKLRRQDVRYSALRSVLMRCVSYSTA